MESLLSWLSLANIATVLCATNFIAFAAFGIDKWRAEQGRRRTPESDLLFLAALGAAPGAYAGRALFRHKTRKQPFSERLHRVAIAEVAVLVFAVTWHLAG
ncbi:MAG: DUF1294 domain-containing protein [Sphingomonadales bacterium]|nr:DUF1294 domain-containing protein [Sphingomonadales bacterium]MBD3775220.1 DUF1294 domain-containing protein [Paracoccaceae bacterium]